MLIDKIKADLTAAMKAGDVVVLSTLRMLVSELNYKQIDLQHDLADSDVEAVVAKEAKKRREAIDSYTKGGRTDSAEAEKKELEILQAYLPKQLTEDEIRVEISKTMSDQEGLDFSGAMKIISPLFRGRADGAVVARIVKEVLSSKS